MRVKEACHNGAYGLSPEQFERLIHLLQTPMEHEGYALPELNRYLDGWQGISGLPADLRPPFLTDDMFGIWRNTSA